MKGVLSDVLEPAYRLYLFDQYEQIPEELIFRALPLLPEERRIRAARYRRKIDRNNCVITYLMLLYGLRECFGIASAGIAYGEYGKPYFPDYPNIHFNISHCDKGCAVVIANRPVGVDIQDVRPFSWDIARRVCCEQELEELEQSQDWDRLFTWMWAVKESVGKMWGNGIIGTVSQGFFLL